MKAKGILVLFFAIWCSIAEGQEKDTSVVLREATIKDYKITANQSFKQATYKVDSLQKTSASTLGEALRENTAIFVKSYGGNGVATLSFRGTGASHTRTYWNNLDIGSPMLGLSDLSTIPLSSFDELDIQYGFASISDGSGALGGSIRLSNAPNWSKENSIQLAQSIGSFNNYQTAIGLELRKNKLKSQTRIFHNSSTNNFSYPDITEEGSPTRTLQNNKFRQIGGLQNFYYQLSDKELVSLKTWVNFTDRNLPAPIIGNTNQFDELEDLGIASILEYQKFNTKSQWLINTGVVRATNTFATDFDTIQGQNEFTSWQSNIRWKYKQHSKSNFEAGITNQLELADAVSYTNSVNRNRFSLFGNWSYNFSSQLGLRLMLREELVDETLSPPIASAGFIYQSHANTKWRANVAHNFRFPTLNDLYWVPGGNRTLNPERSWNFELGYEQVLKVSKLFSSTLDISVFHSTVDDWIQWVPLGSLWSPQNFKKVANSGVELESRGNWKMGDYHFTYFANYAYTHSQTIEGETGIGASLNKQLPYVPFHKVAWAISVSRKKWEVRYSQNYTSQYYIDAENQTFMPQFTVAYLSLSRRDLLDNAKHQLSATFSVNNLLDMPYQILPYRPEAGVHFNLRLTYEIGL